jgi:hypothetical protein
MVKCFSPHAGSLYEDPQIFDDRWLSGKIFDTGRPDGILKFRFHLALPGLIRIQIGVGHIVKLKSIRLMGSFF